MKNDTAPQGEQLFKIMVLEAPVPTALFTMQGMAIQFANKAMLELWGTDETAIGKQINEALSTENAKTTQQILQEVYQSAQTFQANEQLVNRYKGGQLQSLYFNFTYKPLLNADGQVYAVLNTGVDITQQLQSKRDLQAAEQKAQFALDAAEMGTWTLYPITRIAEWDDRCKELCGFNKSDTIVYDDLLKYLHPGDWERVRKAVDHAQNPLSGGNYDIKLRILTGPQQKIRWLRLKGKAYFNTEGLAHRFAGTVIDITEGVELKQAQQQSELKAGIALNAAGLGFWSVYTLENRVELDVRCQQMYGWPNSTIALDQLLTFINPDDTWQIYDALKQAPAVDEKENARIVFRFRRPSDQSERWIRLHGKVFFNEDNKPYYFTGTAEDITEEKRKEETLKNVERRFQTAFDNASVGVVFLSTDGNVILVNKAFSNMLGYSQPELQHLNFKSFGHADENDRHQQLIDQAVSGEIESFVLDKKYIKKDGALVWGRLSSALMRNDDGTPDIFINIVQDITRERMDQEEQHKLLFLIDNSSEFVSLSDLDGQVSYLNKAGQQMVGLDTLQDAIRHNSEYVSPDELDRLKDVINKQLFAHGVWTGKVNYRHFKTGEIIPVQATTMLVYEAATGKPQGRATIARDLRNELAAQTALSDSEQLFKNITTAAPTALWMADADGHITYVNQTWIDWTGRPFEDHLGTGWTKAILDEDKAKAEAQFQGDVVARRYMESHFRITHENGQVRWCITTGNPQYRSDGTFAGYVGACTDITEKTIAEQKLKIVNTELNDQVKQFEFVTDFMPVQLWTAATNGELDYVNRRTQEYFGLPAEEIIGDAWQYMIHEDDIAACVESWTRSLTTGEPYQVEFRLKDKEGVYRWHLARALPFWRDSQLIKWFGTNTDIDEQKQLQRQKDEFIGIASHELKTPVTSIKAYAQVLEAVFRKRGDIKEADMLFKMTSQVNRLTNLITDLLDVTKLHTGKMQFNQNCFDFNEMVKEVIEEVQRTAERHTIIEQYAANGIVYADRDRIGQVITNLITNAIKYSPDADKIMVMVDLKDKELQLRVQDFGIGIARDKKDKVFEQFYRVSGDKQHTFPGLGIGLYISSEIIKREGGKIWVESIEGKGSTFYFSIPLNQLK